MGEHELGPPRTDAEMAGLETVDIIAWFMHWTSHRRAACQCAAPEDFEIDHGRRAADALGRIGRLKEASRGRDGDVNDETTVFVQWKGTDVCLDFHCQCGYDAHFDGDFAYQLRCVRCERIFEMPHTFVLAEATGETTAQEPFAPPRPDVLPHYRRVRTPHGERVAYLPPGTPIPDGWTDLGSYVEPQ